MSAQERQYSVIGQTHINQLNPDSGAVEPGWEIRIKDAQTGVIVPVFVPDSHYGPDQAATLIDHALQQVRAVHALGT